MMTRTPQRGFTLLIAVILSSVALALALTLLDISYKQVTLALASKQSQYAFYNADAALECALYYDQKQDAFNFATPLAASAITCSTIPVADHVTTVDGAIRTTTFMVRCSAADSSLRSASVTVRKNSDASTFIYANGYNTCNTSDERRMERGLKVTY